MRKDDWVHVVILLQFLKHVDHTAKKRDRRAKSTFVILIANSSEHSYLPMRSKRFSVLLNVSTAKSWRSKF